MVFTVSILVVLLVFCYSSLTILPPIDMARHGRRMEQFPAFVLVSCLRMKDKSEEDQARAARLFDLSLRARLLQVKSPHARYPTNGRDARLQACNGSPGDSVGQFPRWTLRLVQNAAHATNGVVVHCYRGGTHVWHGACGLGIRSIL